MSAAGISTFHDAVRLPSFTDCGTLVHPPMDAMDQGRLAVARDSVGAQFGLWQAGAHIGCEVVNEAGALLRNDLITPAPEEARPFYAAVFDFTLDGNPDLPSAPRSEWGVLFQVEDTDAAAERATAGGGGCTTPEDFVYGRTATVTDPFGTEFTIGSPPKGAAG